MSEKKLMSAEELAEGKTSQGEAAPSSANISTAPTIAELVRTAADPGITEDFALALLKRPGLPAEVLEHLAKNVSAVKSRKVKIALASHPNAPRHVSVPLARQFYTFDLMKVALSPGVPADVRIAVDDVLISRLKAITLGERLTLARRASGRVAAALLLEVENVSPKSVRRAPTDRKSIDRKIAGGKITTHQSSDLRAIPREARVMHAALDNPRLTEALVINSVLRPTASAVLVHAVARHEKWSLRKEIRGALLRTEHLSLARALEYGGEVRGPQLRELLNSSRLPAKIKDQLLREIDGREIQKPKNEQ
jgi:hypothetical protein